MVQKRKALSTIAKAAAEAEEDVISKIVGNPKGKVEPEEEEEDVEQEDMTPEEAFAKREQEIKIERTKELKSMYMDELKSLAAENGLATGSKEVMMKALLKHEAKARAERHAQEAKIRAVVIKKKAELENSSMSDLAKLCESIGAKGVKSKPDRVARLLIHWQNNDGVDKALAQIAAEERKSELNEMDNDALRKLCEKAGVDPFVKEIIVDRINKKEHEMGRFKRVVPEKATTLALQDVDMVDTLLANESTRKKEKQEQDELAQKKKDVKSMSVDELKKALTKKGLEATGKKDEMVELLFAANLKEEAVAARKSELKKMAPHDLKALVSKHGLEAAGKEKMVEAVLAQEAKREEELKLFDQKAEEIAQKKKDELMHKSNAQLKSLCQTSGLALGGGKEDKVERLLDEKRNDGTIDKEVSATVRLSRKDELMQKSKDEVLSLCEKMEIDPYLKDVMIERLLAYESETDQPVTKKARKN
jgi:hypothetical protein